MELDRYTKTLAGKSDKAALKITKELVQDIKRNSPVGARNGRYRDGWTYKKDGQRYIIHNKTDYQLTHLLEKGHARVGGGPRVPGRAHIRPAEHNAIIKFELAIKKAAETS